jgi:hypothetical protein
VRDVTLLALTANGLLAEFLAVTPYLRSETCNQNAGIFSFYATAMMSIPMGLMSF